MAAAKQQIDTFYTFKKEHWNKMRNLISDALKQVEEDYGIKFNLGAVHYNDKDFKAPLTCVITDGKVADKYALDKIKFGKECWKYGFAKNDFLKEFEYQGKTWKLKGWNRNGRILAEEKSILAKSYWLHKGFSIQVSDLK